MPTEHHISQQFDAELESIKSHVLGMGGLVERQIDLIAAHARHFGGDDVRLGGLVDVDGRRPRVRAVARQTLETVLPGANVPGHESILAELRDAASAAPRQEASRHLWSADRASARAQVRRRGTVVVISRDLATL